MGDTSGDGWSSNYFIGFGLRETMSGRTKVKQFTTQCEVQANSTDEETEQESSDATQQVTVGGGSYQSEIRWKITCDDTQIISESEGRAPYDKPVTLPECSNCVVDLRDTYGDTWSGNRFIGFGINATVTSENNGGRLNSIDFISPGCESEPTTPVDDDSVEEVPEEEEVDDEEDEADSTEGLVPSNVTVGGGSYKSEVRWSIVCGEQIIEDDGRAPYSEVVMVPQCASCQVNMSDTYKDTWSGNRFVGFGLNDTVTNEDNNGAYKVINFVSDGCPEAAVPEEDTPAGPVDETSDEVDEKDDDDVELDEDEDDSDREEDDDDDEPDEDTWMQGSTSFYMAAYYDKATDYYFPGAEIDSGFNMKKGAMSMSASFTMAVLAIVSLQ